MKIYISGPISNLPIEEARHNFKTIEDAIVKQGHIAVNPMALPHDHDKEWSSYMREDIVALMACDAVIAMPGWEKSEGANLEIQIALALQIKTYGLGKHFNVDLAISHIQK